MTGAGRPSKAGRNVAGMKERGPGRHPDPHERHEHGDPLLHEESRKRRKPYPYFGKEGKNVRSAGSRCVRRGTWAILRPPAGRKGIAAKPLPFVQVTEAAEERGAANSVP